MYPGRPPRATGTAELATFHDRVTARLAPITFCKDDPDSIRAALLAVREAIEGELWVYRENGDAIAISRELWEQLADTLLAYRHRARLTDRECRQLMQWRPAPWFSGDLDQWRRLGPRGLALRVASRIQ